MKKQLTVERLKKDSNGTNPKLFLWGRLLVASFFILVASCTNCDSRIKHAPSPSSINPVIEECH